MRAFVQLRRLAVSYEVIGRKLKEIDDDLDGHDERIETIFDAIRQLMAPPEKERKKIGFEIGRLILKRQKDEGWGTRVIDRLSTDLRREFPGMRGFSSLNLKYMRAFAESYTQKEIVQQAAAQILWFHNCVILDKIQDAEQGQWYIRATVAHSWSRAVPAH
jgi:predicted nuclease of restriction endonuclease-like (RecB) superfamily